MALTNVWRDVYTRIVEGTALMDTTLTPNSVAKAFTHNTHTHTALDIRRCYWRLREHVPARALKLPR